MHGNDNRARASSTTIRTLLLMLGIFLAWITLWWISSIMELAPHTSLWLPQTALSYAVFRHLGYKGIPTVVLASLAVTFVGGGLLPEGIPTGQALLLGLSFAGAHVVPYYLASRLMAR